MRLLNFFQLTIALFFMCTLFASCEDEVAQATPATPIEVWEREVGQATFATERFMQVVNALDEGFEDVSGYVPNMGHHYLNGDLVDHRFEIEKPEIILYLPNAKGEMEMVAIEYAVLPDADNPDTPPAGFTGDQDMWHFNETVGMWQLHVWTILKNPNGVFAPFNPVIGD